MKKEKVAKKKGVVLDFLKPSLFKVIILIVLLSLNFYFYSHHMSTYSVKYEVKANCDNYYSCYPCGGGFLNKLGYVMDFPWAIYAYIYDKEIKNGICSPDKSYFYGWQVIFQLIYFYILSCIIVYIYNRLIIKNIKK